MNPRGNHSMYPVDGAFPSEPMHPQFYPTSPQYNPYAPNPSHQHLPPSGPFSYPGEHDFLREQEQRFSRRSYQQHAHIPVHHSSLPGWECLQCGQRFYSEVERDQHMFECLEQKQPAVPDDPFYESIDNPKPIVLLFWTKERQTLEDEVQLFTKEGEAIALMWSNQEERFQAEVRLSVGEHDGLLSVNDINLSADVHTFYVAEIQRNARMQRIELAINDEREELKKREELVAVEEVEDKGEGENPQKSKKKLNKLADNNHEGDWNVTEGDAKKQIKSLQKEKEKHSQKEAQLREQNRKLSTDCSKYKKHAETLSRMKDDKREQLEGEKRVLSNTISALKKELSAKQAKAENPANRELTAALGRSKSQLDVRDKENTDLSQQLATLQLITNVQENQWKDQQEEIVEKRERVVELEAKLQRLQQEFVNKEKVWQQECEEYKNKLIECNIKSDLELDQVKKELNKSQIISESLKLRLSEAAQLRSEREPQTKPDARTEQAQVQLAPRDGQGAEAEFQAMKRQLQAVEKERDELVLVKKACELDMERLKERLKPGNESKTEPRAPQDPEISKFFQNTIKRKEEELEETKNNLTALREQNLRLEREKEVYFQQVESYKGVLIPNLKKQIHNLEEDQLRFSEVGGSLTSNFEEVQLLNPVSTAVEPDQQNEQNSSTLSAASIPMVQTCSKDTVFRQKTPFTPNSRNLPAAPAVSIQELPLPLHLQKQQSRPQ